MKRYTITLFFVTLLFVVFTYTTAGALEEKYQTVKIGLYYSSTAKSQVTISSNSGFETGYMDSSDFVAISSLELNEFTVSVSNGGIMIGNDFFGMENGNIAFRPINGIVNINGTAYRGGVEFIVGSNGLMTVINFVDINDYVAAVVGKEMSPSWHIEALKAQAVCARSYAIRTWNKHASLGFNLCPTQDCQAYQGLSGETESTVRAATETKDQLLMYGNTVAEALYSSSGGGSTGYAKNVWGNDVAYLVAVADPYDLGSDNPRAYWTVTLTPEKIKEKLSAASVNIGDITDMRVTGCDEFSRTYEVTIYGTEGEYVLKNDRTRSFFGLYSQKYTISSNASQTQSEPVYAMSASGVNLVSDYYIQSGSEITENTDFYMVSQTGISNRAPQASNVAADSYILNGNGWGHGLGMSQYGAKNRAEQGFNYIEILQYYYVGTYVQ